MNYTPNTYSEQLSMLKELELEGHEGLFSGIPENLRLKRPLDLEDGLSEIELEKKFAVIGERNKRFKTILRGAGAYDHYIPAAVRTIADRGEFLTAYTPYQPEISQGILQIIFEYQSMIARLLGMEASNASLYDGASAAAEAINSLRPAKGGGTALAASTVKPNTLTVLRTYCRAYEIDLALIPEKDGRCDFEAYERLLGGGDDVFAVYLEQVNFYGQIEDVAKFADAAHAKNAKLICGAYPTSLGILKNPGRLSADIAVAEGQPLGLPLSFGGPYLGAIAAKKELLRKLPGRIVGETVDKNNKRAFVLTLQAREQHIRREKAASNICSNQAFCALVASAYMAALGGEGLRTAALKCRQNALLLSDGLKKLGFIPKYSTDFFNEFVTVAPVEAKLINAALEKNSILGGLALSENEMLWCATEKQSGSEIDFTLRIIGEAVKGGKA